MKRSAIGVGRTFAGFGAVAVVFVLAAIFLQFGWLVYVALWLLLPYSDGGDSGFEALKRQFSSGTGTGTGSGTSV